MSAETTDGEPIVDKYGTVDRHVGQCHTCGRTVVGVGSHDGFTSVERKLARHINDGSACHDYSINAEYVGGGEARVA